MVGIASNDHKIVILFIFLFFFIGRFLGLLFVVSVFYYVLCPPIRVVIIWCIIILRLFVILGFFVIVRCIFIRGCVIHICCVIYRGSVCCCWFLFTHILTDTFIKWKLWKLLLEGVWFDLTDFIVPLFGLIDFICPLTLPCLRCLCILF